MIPTCESVSLLFLISLIIIFPIPQTVLGSLAKPGCSDTCGKIRIPYPFGLGPSCSLNQSYTIICNSSKPYLANLNLEVLNVSLRNRTVTVNATLTPFCSSTSGRSNETNNVISSSSSISVDLGGTPFFYSKTYNNLMLFGCGNAVLVNRDGNRILSGCTSTCEFDTLSDQEMDTSRSSSCYGVNCCEMSVPFYFSKYRLNFTASRFSSGGNRTGSCNSVFLVDQNWSGEKFSESLRSIPVILAWTLGKNDVQAIYPCPYEMTYLELESGGNLETFMCPTCEFGGINPEDINPYLQQQCGTRVNSESRKRNVKAALIGVFSGIGFLLLVATIFTSYKLIKWRMDKMMRERFFKRNGGLLLQQQLSADDRVLNKTRILTAKELDKATDHFNENRIVGRGGQGTVYKGMLEDGNLAAVKKSRKVDESQVGQFINEVVILSQVIHRNVVKLLGCCLETEVPILVYEYIRNGTLYGLIHNANDDEEFPFTWSLRLRIAAEVAGALSYLHSAVSVPIYHRDIKSSNILLDEKYISKVSDFGTSKTISVDKTHLTTMVKGTFGYLDPEYFQSSQFTEKSDVYSFGVVLVELLTRKKPVAAELEEDSHLSLATRFLMAMDGNRLDGILDPELQDQRIEKEVFAVAKLAQKSLNLNGRNRPTMKEVAGELDRIRMSANQSTNQANYESQEFKKESSGSALFSDTDPTWTSSGTDSITLNLAAYPDTNTF